MTGIIRFPGRYIQGPKTIGQIGAEIERLGESAFILSSPYCTKNIVPQFRQSLKKRMPVKIEIFGGECSDDEIARQVSMAGEADVIVGIGGGKTLDTAKLVATELKKAMIIVPSIAASDAPCSALSVIYTPEGEFQRLHFLPRNPDTVLIDTEIIVNSPVRYISAGMGDALATWFEAESCLRSCEQRNGDCGSLLTAYEMARLCFTTLMEYGIQARGDCRAKRLTPAVEHIVEANTLLSGVGFESGGVAAAHAINEAFTTLEETRQCLHGELVAFGTLASLFLTGKTEDMIDRVYRFTKAVGLPTTLEDINLPLLSDERLMKLSDIACLPDSIIHNEPLTITSALVFDAIRRADKEGQDRKQPI